MMDLWLVLGGSFGLGMLLTPLARAAARRSGLVDAPDGRRKIHDRAVPMGGGIAVFVAALGALGALWLFSALVRSRFAEHGFTLLGLLLASAVICMVGLLDDYRALRGRHKLFGQLAAVGIVMSSGVVVQHVDLFGMSLELGPLALPLTALWLLGAINSLNLIDGMDGLLGSLGTIVCLAMAAVAVAAGQWAAATVACALAGALLAFLCYNFPPASIFLGDCGSMLVGLVVGVLAIQSSLKGPATVALLAPAALLTVPFFDTLVAILRRKLTGRSIYSTDRSHIHHCLQRRGMSNRKVLLVVCSLCMLTVAGTLASLAFKSELMAVIAALAVVAILVVGRLFGHAEFLLVKKRCPGLWYWLLQGNRDGKTHQLAVRLQGNNDWTELWRMLTGRAAELGLRTICFDVNAPALHLGYHARWDRFEAATENPAVWRAELPLLVQGTPVGRLEFVGERGAELVAETMAQVVSLAEAVEQGLARVTLEFAGAAPPDPAEGVEPEWSAGAENLVADPVSQ